MEIWQNEENREKYSKCVEFIYDFKVNVKTFQFY